MLSEYKIHFSAKKALFCPINQLLCDCITYMVSRKPDINPVLWTKSDFVSSLCTDIGTLVVVKLSAVRIRAGILVNPIISLTSGSQLSLLHSAFTALSQYRWNGEKQYLLAGF